MYSHGVSEHWICKHRGTCGDSPSWSRKHRQHDRQLRASPCCCGCKTTAQSEGRWSRQAFSSGPRQWLNCGFETAEQSSLTKPSNSTPTAVSFSFDYWSSKLPAVSDECLAAQITDKLCTQLIKSNNTAEGEGIEHDGEGTFLDYLINDNRIMDGQKLKSKMNLETFSVSHTSFESPEIRTWMWRWYSFSSALQLINMNNSQERAQIVNLLSKD